MPATRPAGKLSRRQLPFHGAARAARRDRHQRLQRHRHQRAVRATSGTISPPRPTSRCRRRARSRSIIRCRARRRRCSRWATAAAISGRPRWSACGRRRPSCSTTRSATRRATTAPDYYNARHRRRGTATARTCPAADPDDPYLPCVENRLKVHSNSIRQMLSPARAPRPTADRPSRCPATSTARRAPSCLKVPAGYSPDLVQRFARPLSWVAGWAVKPDGGGRDRAPSRRTSRSTRSSTPSSCPTTTKPEMALATSGAWSRPARPS